MPSQLRVLRVFLASPGDLQPEREAVREVVQGINHSIGRRLGRQIELLGWEDTRPGYGRPQALINPEVAMCDLFLGLMWKRWGTPTGAASSGFEEEFNLAMHRREIDNAPEMWMCFKHIPNSSLRDPGEQLKSVVAFRRMIQDSRQLLYKDFKNAATLKSLLYETMSAYLLDLTEKDSKEAEPQSASGSASVTPVDQTIDVPPSLVSMMNALGSVLKPGSSVGPEQAARLNLWAASLASIYRQGDPFGTYSTNFIYSYRSNVELTVAEAGYLFETLVSDATDTKPGWYWFREATVDGIVNLPADTSIRISYQFIRGYLEVLQRIQRVPPMQITEKIAADPDDDVRQLLVEHLMNVAKHEQLEALKGLFSAAELNRIRLGALARHSPSAALHALIGAVDSVPGVFQMIPAGVIQDMPLDVLVQAQDHIDLEIRQAVISESDRRSMLDLGYLTRLTKDPKRDVRMMGYRIMARRRLITHKQIEEAFANEYAAKSELLLQYYRSFTDDELVNAFHLFDADTYLALRILVERRHAEYIEMVEHDLLVNGNTLPMLQDQWLKTTVDTTAAHQLQLHQQSLGIFKVFAVSEALHGLLVAVPPHSREIALRWLHNDHLMVSMPATELLTKTATTVDMELLVDLATSNSGELQQKCAEAAFNLCPTVDGPAMNFLQSGDAQLRRLALKLFASRNIYLPDDVTLPLLQHEDYVDRIATVSYLACFKSRSELKSLLSQYVHGFHYYNVVVWLDRIVYAPEPLAQSFKTSLCSTGLPTLLYDKAASM